MATTEDFERERKRALSHRSRRNWILLVCVIIGVVPACAAVAFEVFPQVPDKWVFGIGIALPAIVGFVAHEQFLKGSGRARCPACGGDWEIVEKGSSANAKILESRHCPVCGANW